MTDINDVADYIISGLAEAGTPISLLKLQKLAYYCEAWHEAIYKTPLTGEEFQAWVHGPVSRALFDRFKSTKSLYSNVDISDIRPEFQNGNSLSETERLGIDGVLEVYASYSGTELEAMTHQEYPWILARGNCRPAERCENTIDPLLMRSYYASRIGV
jgi:uncharacterized phage-associated protein